MALTKFISCLSIVTAFIGTIFFVKGFLKITPNVIAAQSETRVGHNDPILKSICSQKSNIVCGFFLVFIATVIQFAGLFINEKIGCFESNIIAIFIVGIIAVFLFIVFNCIDKRYTKNQVLQANKVLCSRRKTDS